MKNKTIWSVVLALTLLLTGYAALNAQTIKQNFEWIIAKRITVTLNGITVQRGGVTVTDGGITVADDDVTVTEGVTAADVTVSDDLTTLDLYVTQSASQTITYGGTITPTGAYHQITAAAARGTSSVAGVSTAGRVVTLVNVGSNTITLTDTGTLKLSGNAALGQYDSITLLSDGTNWIQVSKADN